MSAVEDRDLEPVTPVLKARARTRSGSRQGAALAAPVGGRALSEDALKLSVRPPDDLSPETPAPNSVAVIPAYNEDKYIASVVLKARRHVDLVIVVDDGSSDLTGPLALEAGAVVVTHATNQGKGAALCTGLRRALQLNGRVIVFMDADGQHRADDISSVVAPVLADEADMVVGSRFIGQHACRNIPWWRQIGQRALNLATSVGSRQASSDSQSGFRAFSNQAAQLMSHELQSKGFSVESEMQFIAQKHGLRTVENPIVADYHVKLKRNPVAHGFEVLNGLLRLVGQTRPLMFISVPGLALTVLGVLLGLKVVRIYTATHQLAIGYTALTVLLMEAGLLSIFVGIVLHTMRAFFLKLLERPE